jgi:hypothetical protein
VSTDHHLSSDAPGAAAKKCRYRRAILRNRPSRSTWQPVDGLCHRLDAKNGTTAFFNGRFALLSRQARVT